MIIFFTAFLPSVFGVRFFHLSSSVLTRLLRLCADSLQAHEHARYLPASAAAAALKRSQLNGSSISNSHRPSLSLSPSANDLASERKTGREIGEISEALRQSAVSSSEQNLTIAIASSPSMGGGALALRSLAQTSSDGGTFSSHAGNGNAEDDSAEQQQPQQFLRGVVLDLSCVTSIDSTGVRALSEVSD